MFTFNTTARPAISFATACTSGAAFRQGGHHSAQKSTKIGTRDSRTISSKAAESTSKGSPSGGKGAWQDPHRPTSDRCLAETRLAAPHWAQVRSDE